MPLSLPVSRIPPPPLSSPQQRNLSTNREARFTWYSIVWFVIYFIQEANAGVVPIDFSNTMGSIGNSSKYFFFYVF